MEGDQAASFEKRLNTARRLDTSGRKLHILTAAVLLWVCGSIPAFSIASRTETVPCMFQRGCVTRHAIAETVRPEVGATLEWGFEGAFNRPTFANSLLNGGMDHFELFGPVDQVFSLTFVGDKNADTAVSRLLIGSFPSTIRQLVVPVVVLPSYGMIHRGAKSHIFQELFESEPTVTYQNTTSAISRELGVTRVPTPSQHTGPRYVRGCFGQAVASISCRYEFVLSTTAGLGFTAYQLGPTNRNDVAAITSAYPSRISAVNRGIVPAGDKECSVAHTDKGCVHTNSMTQIGGIAWIM